MEDLEFVDVRVTDLIATVILRRTAGGARPDLDVALTVLPGAAGPDAC